MISGHQKKRPFSPFENRKNGNFVSVFKNNRKQEDFTVFICLIEAYVVVESSNSIGFLMEILSKNINSPIGNENSDENWEILKIE